MLRDMPLGAWIFWIVFLLVLVSVPNFQVRWVFECSNGVFYKTWKRNKKLIRAEWSKGKRLLLLHFWDRRVCSRYRIWYVGYVIYLLQLIFLVISQSIDWNAFFPGKIGFIFSAICTQLFVIQLVCIILWLAGLVWLAYSVVSIVPRHYSQRYSKKMQEERNPVGHAIIWAIFILGNLGMIGSAILNIVEILENL